MSLSRTHWSTLIWFALPTLVGLRSIAAQEKSMTIALVQTLADSTATATIIREPGSKGRTLVVVREDSADATTLAAALTSLDRSRLFDGEELTNEVIITLHGRRSPASLRTLERQRADAYVSRLRNAKPEQLAGFGLAKTLVVTLAPLPKTG